MRSAVQRVGIHVDGVPLKKESTAEYGASYAGIDELQVLDSSLEGSEVIASSGPTAEFSLNPPRPRPSGWACTPRLLLAGTPVGSPVPRAVRPRATFSGEFLWVGTGRAPGGDALAVARPMLSAVPLAGAAGVVGAGPSVDLPPAAAAHHGGAAVGRVVDLGAPGRARGRPAPSGVVLVRRSHLERLDVCLDEVMDSSDGVTLISRAMRRQGFRLLFLSGDPEHPVEGQLGLSGRVGVDRDAVDHIARHELLERPRQVGGVDAEHRRAGAHQRVE